MRQNTYLKAQKCSKFVAWPHVRNNYSHESESVSSYEFCNYFIDRGLANRAKSWIQLRTNTVHYHFAFLSPGSCFKSTICIQLESAPISDRLVFAAVEGWQNYSPVVRKIWGLRWPWSSIQKPPKHRFMFYPSMLSAKEVILRSRNETRDFKIHYGGLLLRLPRPWGTRLTTPFPPQTSNRLRFRCTATGCSASTCLYKNEYVRLYSTFIWQRLDQWQWFPSLVSILHLPELTFASQLLLAWLPVIPTTKRNNTDKKRVRCSYNVISPKIQSFQF